MVPLAGTFLEEGLEATRQWARENLWHMGIAIGVGAWGMLHIWSALGLHQRRPGVRIPASLIAGSWVLYFPIGTGLGGLMLWLIWSARSRRGFEPADPAVGGATPPLDRAAIPGIAKVLIVFALAVSTGIAGLLLLL